MLMIENRKVQSWWNIKGVMQYIVLYLSCSLNLWFQKGFGNQKLLEDRIEMWNLASFEIVKYFLTFQFDYFL